MKGLRVPAMRRRLCVRCNTSFLPKRTDAKFCSDGCRQADHRAQKLKVEADKAFKTTLRIAQNAHHAGLQLDLHRGLAMTQNLAADNVRANHIRFMGIQKGVLAVQASREILPCQAPWWPAGWSWLKVEELTHEPANPDAGDPEVIEAVVEALQHETLGGSFMQRQFEKECRALLRGPVKRISLFTMGYRDAPVSKWSFLVPARSDSLDAGHDDWDEVKNWDRANEDGVAELIRAPAGSAA
jgi:hypothetical protein